MSIKPQNYWLERAAAQLPNCVRMGRVVGQGPFVLLSCKDGESRHAYLFLEPAERNRHLWRWDRNHCCGVKGCTDDHRMIELKVGRPCVTEETTNQNCSPCPTA